MKLRVLTIVAFALIAFYAGIVVDAARTADDSLLTPERLPSAPLPVTFGGVGSNDATYTVTITSSHSDPVLTAAAIGAIVSMLFLLARLAVIVARRVRASH